MSAVTGNALPSTPNKVWKVGDRFRFTQHRDIPVKLKGMCGELVSQKVNAFGAVFQFLLDDPGWNGTTVFSTDNASEYCEEISPVPVPVPVPPTVNTPLYTGQTFTMEIECDPITGQWRGVRTAPTPRTLTCSTCSRNADAGAPCWWCGGANP